MTMHSTTKRLPTTASALLLGFLLSGSLAMAADTPADIQANTPSTAPASVEVYHPHWTLADRRQHWEETLQSARDLWAKVSMTPEERQETWENIKLGASDLLAKWGLAPEQRQQYWEEMQQGWHDLEAMMNPPAETLPTVAVVAPAASSSAALDSAAASPPKRVHNILTIWRMTPEQRKHYWEYMQTGGKMMRTNPLTATPPKAPGT